MKQMHRQKKFSEAGKDDTGKIRKNRKKSGLRVKVEETASSALAASCVWGGALAFLWYAAFLFAFAGTARNGMLISGAGVIAVCTVLAALCGRQQIKKRFSIILAGMVVLFLAAAVIFWNRGLSDSVRLLVNQFLETVGKRTGIYYGQFPTGAESTLSAGMVMGLFAGLIFWYMLYRRQDGGVAFLLVLSALLLLGGFYRSPVWAFFAVCTGLLLFACLNGMRAEGGKKGRFFLPYLPAVLICLAAAFLVLPAAETEGDSLLSRTGDFLQEQVRLLRYGDSVLPDGQIREAEACDRSEETALRVVMSRAESLYLRGFVGSRYEDGAWEMLEPETYYEAYQLFYWLHEDGFSGLTQLSALESLLQAQSSAAAKGAESGENAENTEARSEDIITVRVQNLNASRNYYYLPYEYAAGTAEGTVLADERLKAGGWSGVSSYGFETRENLVKNYPELAEAYFQYQNGVKNGTESEDTSAYTEAEQYYNAFVYENYRELSEEDREVLSSVLGDYSYEGVEHLGYGEAKVKIVSWLNENLTYRESAGAIPEDAQTLSYILTERKAGYDIHYATAAVLMYRYFGIPARYVEGYLITKTAAQNAADYTPIEVAESDAHAWVEIYQDGIGWVPVETVGAYMDLMEQPPDVTLYNSGDSEYGDDETETETYEDEEEEPERRESRREHIRLLVIVTAVILSVLVLVLILTGVFFLKRRQKKIQLRDASFAAEDRSRAVRALFRWCVSLWATEGILFGWESLYDRRTALAEHFGAQYGEAYDAVVRIVYPAVFSGRETVEADYERVKQFVKETRSLVRKRKKYRQILKFWWQYPKWQ